MKQYKFWQHISSFAKGSSILSGEQECRVMSSDYKSKRKSIARTLHYITILVPTSKLSCLIYFIKKGKKARVPLSLPSCPQQRHVVPRCPNILLLTRTVEERRKQEETNQHHVINKKHQRQFKYKHNK